MTRGRRPGGRRGRVRAGVDRRAAAGRRHVVQVPKGGIRRDPSPRTLCVPPHGGAAMGTLCVPPRGVAATRPTNVNSGAVRQRGTVAIREAVVRVDVLARLARPPDGGVEGRARLCGDQAVGARRNASWFTAQAPASAAVVGPAAPAGV